jgi:large subunit ribosomal protein L31
MRDIHPSYPASTISCACGNQVPTRTTRGDFTVDVCSNCHPFYTGKQKLMDTAGRVDRFRKKFAEAKPAAQAGAERKASDAKKAAKKKAASEE